MVYGTHLTRISSISFSKLLIFKWRYLLWPPECGDPPVEEEGGGHRQRRQPDHHYQVSEHIVKDIYTLHHHG